MSWPMFISEVVLLSLSGVMAPGPLTAVGLTEGSRDPRAGIMLSVGHGLVEVPLMVLLLLGFGALVSGDVIQRWLLASGGIVLLVMGVQILLKARATDRSTNTGKRRVPLVAGMLLSAGNPYFIVWWSTVGLTLIWKSSEVGTLGFPVLVAVHWLCDLCWLGFLSLMSWKAGAALGARFQRVVGVVAGVVLLVFAARFLAAGYVSIAYGM